MLHRAFLQVVKGDFNFPLDNLHEPPPEECWVYLWHSALWMRVRSCRQWTAGRSCVRTRGWEWSTPLASMGFPHCVPLAEGAALARILGHQAVCFDLYLQGAKRCMPKFVRPPPVAPLHLDPYNNRDPSLGLELELGLGLGLGLSLGLGVGQGLGLRLCRGL